MYSRPLIYDVLYVMAMLPTSLLRKEVDPMVTRPASMNPDDLKFICVAFGAVKMGAIS
jgi:hypothetical protein